MKQTVTLTITSLLTILFFTFHLADDIVRGKPGSVLISDSGSGGGGEGRPPQPDPLSKIPVPELAIPLVR